MDHLPTVVLRHRRENLKKCSLRGLEGRFDFQFYTYPYDFIAELPNYVMLSFDGPLLSQEDAKKGLFILDGTWAYADKMYKNTPLLHTIEKRSLPANLKTAYPRRQEDCSDIGRGLSSIEAIFAAYSILGHPTKGLFDHYLWGNLFLEKNIIFYS